jgi:hypothetical protein
MRSRASITFIAVGVVAFVLAISAAPAQARTRCQLRGSSTIVQTSSGRIFSKPGTERLFSPPQDIPVVHYYGCLFSVGKRYSLGFNANADYCLPFVSTWRLAGRYGAFLEVRGCDSGPDGGAVVRRDLKTGVVVRDDTPAQVASDAPDSPFVTERPGYQPIDLVLTASGALAWDVPRASPSCSGTSLPCRVIKSDRDGRAVLDEGFGIVLTSLELRGSTVSWIRDGIRRSATLR